MCSMLRHGAWAWAWSLASASSLSQRLCATNSSCQFFLNKSTSPSACVGLAADLYNASVSVCFNARSFSAAPARKVNVRSSKPSSVSGSSSASFPPSKPSALAGKGKSVKDLAKQLVVDDDDPEARKASKDDDDDTDTSEGSEVSSTIVRGAPADDVDTDSDDKTRVPLTKEEFNQLKVKARKRQLESLKTEAFEQLAANLRSDKEERRRAEASKASSTIEQPIDHQIQAAEVMLIDEDGKRLGIMQTKAAIAYAHDKLMNIMQVSPLGGGAGKDKDKDSDKDKEKDKNKEGKSSVVVCKVVDTGKLFYERTQREHEARRKARSKELKSIRFRTKTELNDAKFKLNQGLQFLQKGHIVRIAIANDAKANNEESGQNNDNEDEDDEHEQTAEERADSAGQESQSSSSSSPSSTVLSPSAYFQQLCTKFQLEEHAQWDANWESVLNKKGYVELTPLTEKQKEKRKKELEKKEKEAKLESTKNPTATSTHQHTQTKTPGNDNAKQQTRR